MTDASGYDLPSYATGHAGEKWKGLTVTAGSELIDPNLNKAGGL